MPLTVNELLARWPFRPLWGCPGRFVLPQRAGGAGLSAAEIAQAPPVAAQSLPGAADPVECVPLPGGGGLISYIKPDGARVHTLCTEEGWLRKLAMLTSEP